MIGWRVGWVAGPRAVMADVTRAHLFNVVTPVSLTQPAAVAALRTPDADVAAAVTEWQRRRDAVVAELADHDVVPAAGGWSLLVDVAPLGLTAREAWGCCSSAVAWRRRRWTAGGRPTARSTSGSSSPTSRLNGSPGWARGSRPRWASGARPAS